MIGVYYFTESARRYLYCVISIAASIDFMLAAFSRVDAPAEALPAQYVKEGLLCRADYAYGEAGWTVDEAACYSKGICSIFSHLFI